MDSPARPTAKDVGDAFAEQYYFILRNYPMHLRLLYKDDSKITRPALDGIMRHSTLSSIDDKDLNMLSSGGFDSVKVNSVISQYSQGGSVFVFVDGYFTSNERPARNFIQTFFLAPQEIGYYAFNYLFKFVDISESSANNETEEVPDESLRVSEEPNDGLEGDEGNINGQGQGSSSDHPPEIKADTGNGNNVESHAICVRNLPPNANIGVLEDAFKQFGEIRRGGSEVRKKWGSSYGFLEFKEAKAAQTAVEASPILLSGGRRLYVEKKRAAYRSYWETPSSDAVDDTVNGNNQESQVFVKSLPPNVTNDLIENAFNKFGRVKRIEVRNPGMDYYFAFVEFKEANAAERAIMASPVWVGGRKVHVEKKRNTVKNYRAQRRIHEEQGRQYNQNRYRSEQMKGTRVDDFWECKKSTEEQMKKNQEQEDEGKSQN